MHPVNTSEMTFDDLLGREWLNVNGLGGYACATLCGLNTRKYHGLLVAAMSAPVRRMVLLSHVDEMVFTPQGEFALSCNEYPGTIFPRGYGLLRAFSGDPFPRWAYQGEGFTIEKSLRLLPGENTVCLEYALLAGEKSVRLEIKPLLALRGIHELMYQWNSRLSAENKGGQLVHIPASSRTPEIFFAHDGEFRVEPHWHLNTIYRREIERGYAGLEDLWKPGLFRWTLAPGQLAHLACSVEPVEISRVRADLDRAREDFDRRSILLEVERDQTLETLIQAAGAFVVKPASQGQAAVQVMAQYPWSPPTARAALTGFVGLFLVPGRFEQGRAMLLSLAGQMRDGLIPTEFPESGVGPLYTGADTSLWFINAVGEYFRQVADVETIGTLLGTMSAIIDAYRHGAPLGIVSDSDALVASRAPGVATSWMDAEVGDWIVTPRQGRTVELNALWYNALRSAAALAKRLDKQTLAEEWLALSQKVHCAFNQRFWNEDLGCCFDVVEDHGMDRSVRPNQILAVSLPHPVLAAERHRKVVQKVLDELLTPYGLRTLSPRDPAYQGHYRGNVLNRERAQHQGSAYPWLLGALTTAYLRAFGRDNASLAQVQLWLEPCLNYLTGPGLGQLCELFDGDEPHRPGGALASALSVAEILRCYAQDVLEIPTVRPKALSIPVSTGSSPLIDLPK